MANKPRIRFKGFTEDWEQCKLGEIFEYLQNNTLSRDSLNYKNPNIKNIHYGDILVKFDEILDGSNKDIPYINSELDLSKFSKSLLRDGDIIFSDTAEDDTVGKAIELQNVNAPFILGGLHTIPCRPLIPFGKGYLGNFLNSDSYRLQLRPLIQGIKVSSISKSALKDTMIEYPKNLDEQEKIGSLFYYIAKMITLHQCKLEKLKLTKKALLQKLFPKNGKHIPEIRFKGFTDAWEQRKLNDFGIATGGTSIESEFVDGGTYKVISIGSYSEESVYNDQGLRVNKTDKTKFRILNKDDLTMILNDKTASGNIIGRVLLIDQDNTYVYNQRTERIEVDTKNFLPMFLYHMLNAPEQRKYIVKASQGNTQIYVNWSTINNIDYMIPQLLLEQEKIANLFSLINKDITLHQRKLERLQEVKKGLLQKMFV